MSEPSDSREQAQGNAASRVLEIQREQHAQAQELASLAARICPELCQKNPSRAIEIAQALLHEAERKTTKSEREALFKAFLEMVAESTEAEMKARGEVYDEGLKKAFLNTDGWKETIDGLPRKVAEYLDTKFGKYRKFEPGVKLITGEKRLDRAMPWFRKFIRSQTPNEEACNAEIAKARKDGFTAGRLLQLWIHFDAWKAKEKSRMARTKSAKRKKKGQV